LAVGGATVRRIDAGIWLDVGTGEVVERIDQWATCYAVPPQLDRYVLGGANNWRALSSVTWVNFPRTDGWQSFGSATREVPPSYPQVHGLAFDSTGRRLAIGHVRRQREWKRPAQWYAISVVDTDHGQRRVYLEVAEEARVMAFNHDGSLLAVTGGLDGNSAVDVYTLASRQRVAHFEPSGTITRVLHFLPDDRWLIVNNRCVAIFSMKTQSLDVVFPVAGRHVNAAITTADGQLLFTAHQDGTIGLWQTHTGTPVAGYDFRIGPITALTLSPDGYTGAAAGSSGRIILWDIEL
jgi:WD40 repeat protein